MKFALYILIMLLPVFYGGNVTAGVQTGILSDINSGLNNGNVSQISQYFEDQVDITINSSMNTYSRAQADIILLDFFKKNKPRNFNFERNVNAATAPGFCLGSLYTSTGLFHVFIFLKQGSKGYVLKDIRLER